MYYLNGPFNIFGVAKDGWNYFTKNPKGDKTKTTSINTERFTDLGKLNLLMVV
jgi:hypothetical protein